MRPARSILLVLIVLIGVMMASLSFTLGLMTREGGILAGITNTFILPLLILSGVMLPIGFGPPVIQTISRFDPFYLCGQRRAGPGQRRLDQPLDRRKRSRCSSCSRPSRWRCSSARCARRSRDDEERRGPR